MSFLLQLLLCSILLLFMSDKNSFSHRSHLMLQRYCIVNLLFILNVSFTQSHTNVYPFCLNFSLN
jgi:hypothetical protein